MQRRLLNILAAVSLVLFVLAIAYWLRSYLPQQLRISALDGRLFLTFADIPITWTAKDSLAIIGTDVAPNLSWHLLGIEVAAGKMGSGDDYCIAAVPFPYIVAPLAALPAWWLLVMRRRRNREKRGFCMNCGYDLRASKDKCPECGTAIPANFPTLPTI